MEAFFQLRQSYRTSTFEPRIYRSTAKLLSAVEARQIAPANHEATFEVKLFTDHEAWDEDFSQDELTNVINELVGSFSALEDIEYMADGVTVVGEHPDFKRLTKEWRAKSLPKLQAAVRGLLK